MLSLNYDRRFDVLYIRFCNSEDSYGEEDDFGVVTHKDFTTDKITGLTIFDFSRKCETNQFPTVDLPVEIDYRNLLQTLEN